MSSQSDIDWSQLSCPSSPQLDDYQFYTQDTQSDNEPDEEPEIHIQAAESDPSLLLAEDLSHTKAWISGRAQLHGSFNNKALKSVKGLCVIPLSDITLLRDSREFKHLTWLPLTQSEYEWNPLFSHLLNILQ